MGLTACGFWELNLCFHVLTLLLCAFGCGPQGFSDKDFHSLAGRASCYDPVTAPHAEKEPPQRHGHLGLTLGLKEKQPCTLDGNDPVRGAPRPSPITGGLEGALNSWYAQLFYRCSGTEWLSVSPRLHRRRRGATLEQMVGFSGVCALHGQLRESGGGDGNQSLVPCVPLSGSTRQG